MVNYISFKFTDGSEYIAHHGIKGQKWGIRRYQNPDGTLTDAGRKRVSKTTDKISKMYDKMNAKTQKRIDKYNRKGKLGKANSMKYIFDSNENAKKEKIERLGNMSYKSFKKEKHADLFNVITKNNEWRGRNGALMTSPFSRVSERYNQFRNRIGTTFTFDSTLRGLSGETAYYYTENKRKYNTALAKFKASPG